MASQEESKKIRAKYFEKFKKEGEEHIPPINPSWVNKFINRYLASETVLPIEEKWEEYLKNKRGKTDWEFFTCAQAEKFDNGMCITSIYHLPLNCYSTNKKFIDLINDYCKQNDLQFKKINDKKYELGFYRKVFKNKK